MAYAHYPIMKEEVCTLLAPSGGGQVLVDCTTGEGGHSLEFLTRYPDLRLISLDRDRVIQRRAKERLAPYGERVSFEHAWFDEFLQALGDCQVDRVFMDLGISTFHYQERGRGFSFSDKDGLDMRLDESSPVSAYGLVNDLDEKALGDLIFEYGEERYSRSIAKAIVKARAEGPISSAEALGAIVRKAVPLVYSRKKRLHPATKTFQALRIYVNNEILRLRRALVEALRVLRPQGRLGVISFHSLEDRAVKSLFREMGRSCVCPPELPRCACGGQNRVIKILTPKPVLPGGEELKENPPSRSAKLRVAERCSSFWRLPHG